MKILKTLNENKLKVLNPFLAEVNVETIADLLEDGLSLSETIRRARNSHGNKYLNSEEYILFSADYENISLSLVSKNAIIKVLKSEVAKYHSEILMMISVSRAYNNSAIYFDDMEYFEEFVVYIQYLVLKDFPRNYYIALSAYIVEYLYDYFGENVISDYNHNHAQNSMQLIDKRKEVEHFLESIYPLKDRK